MRSHKRFRRPVIFAIALAIGFGSTRLIVQSHAQIAGTSSAAPTSIKLLKMPIVAEMIHDVVYSPDGKLIAIGSGSANDWNEVSVIRVWDLVRRKFLWTRSGCHPRDLTGLAFSPGGKLLASVGGDDSVKLWNVRTGMLQRQLRLSGSRFISVAFSPDGKLLAAGDHLSSMRVSLGRPPGAVKLWDLRTGKLQRTLQSHNGDVLSVAFSPDGKILATGANGPRMMLWNPMNGKLLKVLKNGLSYEVVFSPDGKTLACTSSRDGKEDERSSLIGQVKLWNVANGALKHTLEGFLGHAKAVEFSPDGQTVVGAGYDGSEHRIKFWDTRTGKLRRLLRDEGDVLSVAFSPDGKTLATVGNIVETRNGTLIRSESNVKLWNLR